MGQHHPHTPIPSPEAPLGGAAADRTSPQAVRSPLLAEMLREISNKQYDKAIRLSNKQKGQDPDVVNALGVCLMRVGRYEDAVTLFRNLVLERDRTWMRKDRPLHYRTNFATALLLSGRPSGCLEMLHEMRTEAPPLASVLRSAIKRWESTLSFWSWLDWKMSRIEPKNTRITLDVVPGELGVEPTRVDGECHTEATSLSNGKSEGVLTRASHPLA